MYCRSLPSCLCCSSTCSTQFSIHISVPLQCSSTGASIPVISQGVQGLLVLCSYFTAFGCRASWSWPRFLSSHGTRAGRLFLVGHENTRRWRYIAIKAYKLFLKFGEILMNCHILRVCAIPTLESTDSTIAPAIHMVFPLPKLSHYTYACVGAHHELFTIQINLNNFPRLSRLLKKGLIILAWSPCQRTNNQKQVLRVAVVAFTSGSSLCTGF